MHALYDEDLGWGGVEETLCLRPHHGQSWGATLSAATLTTDHTAVEVDVQDYNHSTVVYKWVIITLIYVTNVFW